MAAGGWSEGWSEQANHIRLEKREEGIEKRGRMDVVGQRAKGAMRVARSARRALQANANTKLFGTKKS